MLPYSINKLMISNHVVTRFQQRLDKKNVDDILIRAEIKDYLSNVDKCDIYETKEGTYYVKYHISKPKNNLQDFYFVLSKDNVVMTFSFMTIDKMMNMVR